MQRRAGRAILAAVALGATLTAGVVATGPSSAQAAGPEVSGRSDWTTVSVGEAHSCGIRRTGRLYCWGYNGYGQLGDGGTNDDKATPTLVTGGFTDWTTVSTGHLFTCARRANGRVYCWGDDGYGQLGNGPATGEHNTPTLVAAGFTDWTTVSAGGGQACGRRGNGRLYCWGRDDYGQLGDGGTNTLQPSPRLVAGGFTDWTSVTAGGFDSCGRRTNGRLYCWGDDEEGELGNGAPELSRGTPQLVAGGATNWTIVNAGHAHACGLRTTGRLYCWGDDAFGQLGDGGALDYQVRPVLVAGGATDWTSVEAGQYQTCARRSSGRLWCWGYEDSGRLGNGTTAGQVETPVQVAGGATDWAAVSTGFSGTCATTRTGRLYCWGSDANSALGDGTPDSNQPRPVEVAG